MQIEPRSSLLENEGSICIVIAGSYPKSAPLLLVVVLEDGREAVFGCCACEVGGNTEVECFATIFNLHTLCFGEEVIVEVEQSLEVFYVRYRCNSCARGKTVSLIVEYLDIGSCVVIHSAARYGLEWLTLIPKYLVAIDCLSLETCRPSFGVVTLILVVVYSERAEWGQVVHHTRVECRCATLALGVCTILAAPHAINGYALLRECQYLIEIVDYAVALAA